MSLKANAGAATAGVLIAEAHFVASHGETLSSAALFPSRRILADLLRYSDADRWRNAHDVDGPEWLTENDD